MAEMATELPKTAIKIREAREVLGLSFEDLGAKIGVTGQTVRYWAAGRTISRLGKACYAKALRLADAERARQAQPTTAPEVQP